MIDFWDLTSDQILRGIEISRNPSAAKPSDPLIEFFYYPKLQMLAMLWVECNRDMTLMKVKYYDTLLELNNDAIYCSPVGHA